MPKKGQFSPSATEDSKKQRKYNSKPEQKKNRAERNRNRRQADKQGKVSKGDGKDIDHKKPMAHGGSSSPSNLRVRSKVQNRRSGGGIRSR